MAKVTSKAAFKKYNLATNSRVASEFDEGALSNAWREELIKLWNGKAKDCL